MLLKKKNRFKPLYKQFDKLRENVQDRKKIFKFKKKKWERLINNYKRKLAKYQKFKPKDQNREIVTKYPNKGTSYKKLYARTLQSSKKLRLLYGSFLKKNIKNKIKIAITKKQSYKKFPNIKILFLELFESRLDTVLYRSKFSLSLRSARQLIVHNKVFVNNKPIKSSSYFLKPGDLINIDPKYSYLIHSNLKNIKKQQQRWPIPPKHLLINYKTMQIIFGNFKSTNLSTIFTFNLELSKILSNYSRQ